MSLSAESKVLIVGGGIAGLALAQILRKQGIPFEVYEREEGIREGGWGVHIDKCLDELEPMLPEDIGSLEDCSANHAVGKLDGFAIYNAQTHELLGALGHQPRGQPGYAVGGNRNDIRRVLLKNLPIHAGKALQSFEQDDKGVTVHFTDGTTARGDILIGADGANSRVRRQLVGVEAIPSKYTMFQGTVTLPESVYSGLLEHSTCGPLIGEPTRKGNCLLLKYNADGTATFGWAMAYRPEDPEKEREWAKNATAEEMFEKAKLETKDWPERYVKAIGLTPVESIAVPPVRLLEIILPEDTLPSGRVTLVGDSATAMVPFRGMGANIGLQNACLLGRTLIQGFKSGADIDQLLRVYEATMIPSGRDNVLLSRLAGEDDSFDVSGGRLEELRERAKRDAAQNAAV